MEVISVSSIVIICYLIAELFKLLFLKKTNFYKAIPIIVGCVGGLLGYLLFRINPSVICNASNPIAAISIGIASGLASTGSNQIIKQMTK